MGELCLTCFKMRLPGTDQWIAEDVASRHLVASNEPTYFYRWRAGTFGYPGNYTQSIIATATHMSSEDKSYSCLSSSANGSSAHFEDVGFGDTLPRGCTRSDCVAYQWRASKPPSADGSNPFLIRLTSCAPGVNGTCQVERSLLGGGRGDVVEVVCDHSCGLGITGGVLNARGWAVLVPLLGLLVLPLLLVLIYKRCRQHAHVQHAAITQEQWPARRRPWAVLCVCQASWLLLLLSVTPSLLWFWGGRLWRNRASSYLPLAQVGITGLMLCFRADDPPALLWVVSLTMTVAIIAISYSVLSYLGALAADLGCTDDADAPGDLWRPALFFSAARQCPWSGAFQTWAIDFHLGAVMLVVMVLTLGFVTSQMRILVPRWRHGLWRPPPGLWGACALSWLWASTRTLLLCLAVGLILLSISMGITIALIPLATPLERTQASELVQKQLIVAVCCLVSYAVGSPRLRLLIHNANWKRLRSMLCPSVLNGVSFAVAAPPPPVELVNLRITPETTTCTARTATRSGTRSGHRGQRVTLVTQPTGD